MRVIGRGQAVLLEMLPFYLLGNLHCLGMCGPFALAIGGQQGKYFYLIGRFLGFTFASAFAALFGQVLSKTPIAPLIPFFMGILFLLFFLHQLPPLPALKGLEKLSTRLLLNGKRSSLFLFGFLTLLLPCGQSLLLYGVSAMKGDFIFGCMNGALFALLTTPSLLFAMHLAPFLRGAIKKWGPIYSTLCSSDKFACLCKRQCRTWVGVPSFLLLRPYTPFLLVT